MISVPTWLFVSMSIALAVFYIAYAHKLRDYRTLRDRHTAMLQDQLDREKE